MSEAPPGTPDPSDEIIRDLKRKVAELEKERDNAREYGKETRIRENKAEDARIHEQMLRHAAEADKARLSEAVAGLCDWIENEVGAELPFAARAALSGSGSGWRGSYRLLETTDTIQAGDEVIGDDGVTWCPVDRWSIGCEVSRLFKSIRRASPAAPQQEGE